MENDKKILACVDQSTFAVHVADYAAWAARCVSAPLEFLHAIDHHPERGPDDDLSGAIGIGTQEQLLDKLAADEATRIAAERDQCREFLNGLRERAFSAGTGLVEVRQRHGRLEEVLAEQARDLRLIVMGHGGSGDIGTVTGRLGANVEHVVRAVHVPVLIVSNTFKEPQRVMIAFDGRPAAKRAVDMVASSLCSRAWRCICSCPAKGRTPRISWCGLKASFRQPGVIHVQYSNRAMQPATSLKQ